MATHRGTNTPLSRLWTFGTTSYSSSAWSIHPLTGYDAPAMEATTEALYLQKSDDPSTTADADATWVAVKDSNGNQVSLPVSTSAQSVQIDPGLKIDLRRTRVQAVDSGGSGVSQSSQVITPRRAVL